jgi:hypothetical protein
MNQKLTGSESGRTKVKEEERKKSTKTIEKQFTKN